MKVGITGHTRGIGLALANQYQQQGYEVIGFSRSNGYDISDHTHRQRIVKDSQNCDLFINNAYAWESGRFSQVDMLFDIWQAWRGQRRRIINIGSSIVMRWDKTSVSPWYRAAKLCLEQSCESLWHMESWPSVSVISPCLTDTDHTIQITSKNKVQAKTFAALVYQCDHAQDFRMPIVRLNVLPAE